MIKRLTFLIISTCLAVFLSACGDNAEKKVETKGQQEMEQPKTDADSKENVSVLTPQEDVSDVSQAATDSANQTAEAASETPSDRTASSESSDPANPEQPA